MTPVHSDSASAVISDHPEFPNIIGLWADLNNGSPLGVFLHHWETLFYSFFVVFLLTWAARRITQERNIVPGRVQNFAEYLVTFFDDFVCSLMGPRGHSFTPFIGTLFLYILSLNLLGLIPFLKSPTADLSTTLGLALIVFCYVQYTAFKELGVRSYLDHLMGQPRGMMAATLIMPIFMFVLHFVSEIVRPVSLSLRLRSNVFGDDVILALFASWGLKAGFMWLFPNFLLVILFSTIQAAVFSILTTVYLSLVMKHDEVVH